MVAELDAFAGREQALRSVTRYSLYQTMMYRSNLWTHSRRVAWIVQDLLLQAGDVFGSACDPRRAMVLGAVHDDAEVVTGDYQASEKERMSEEELARIDRIERTGIQQMIDRFPLMAGIYVYGDLLDEARAWKTLESHIVKFADKLDGLGEALHELYAGNHLFATNVVNERGKLDTPVELYQKFFAGLFETYPDLEPLKLQVAPLLEGIAQLDQERIVQHGALHEEATIWRETGDLVYDYWKDVQRRYDAEGSSQELCTIKETLG